MFSTPQMLFAAHSTLFYIHFVQQQNTWRCSKLVEHVQMIIVIARRKPPFYIVIQTVRISVTVTPLKANISPENWWLENDSCPFKMVPFQGTFVHFQGVSGYHFFKLKEEFQLMVNCWFGARWFGFLGSPSERECYLGVFSISNIISFREIIMDKPSTWTSEVKISDAPLHVASATAWSCCL